MFSPPDSIDTDDMFDEDEVLPNFKSVVKYIRIIRHGPPQERTESHSDSGSFETISIASLYDTSFVSSGSNIIQKHLEEYGLSTYKVSYILTDCVLRERLTENLIGQLKVKLETDTAILTYTEDDSELLDVEQVEQIVIGELKRLHDELIEITTEFDRENYDLTLRHFDFYMGISGRINVYGADSPFTICFVLPDDNNIGLIEHHIDIVRKQKVVERRIHPLNETDKIIVLSNIDNISYSPAIVKCYDDEVIISGFDEDTQFARTCISRLLRKRRVKIHRLSKYERVLFLNEDYVIERLSQENMETTWWRIENDTLQVEGMSKNHVEKSMRVILDSFKLKKFELKDEILLSEKWTKLKTHLLNIYESKIVIDEEELPDVSIYMLDDIFDDVDEQIGYFIKRYCIVTQLVYGSAGRCLFMLENLKTDMEAELSGELLSLNTGPSNESITVVGTDTAIRIVRERLLRISTQRFGVARQDVNKLNNRVFEGLATKFKLSIQENPIVIRLKRGRIEEEQVDVVVNSAARNLQLFTDNTSAIKHSLIRAAGPHAQPSLRPLSTGSVFVGNPGNLRCHDIYHVILGPFRRGERYKCIQELKTVVKDCLRKAAACNYTSISFPAIATGVLKYPNELVADTILDVIVQFVNTEDSSTLRRINIVVLDGNTKTWNAFKAASERREQALSDLEESKSAGLLRSPPSLPCCYCRITAAIEDDLNKAVAAVELDMQQQTIPMKLADQIETRL